MFPSMGNVIALSSSVCATQFTVQWVLQVMLPSACSFIVLVFTVFRYMFRPTWPSSGVTIFLFSYAWRILLRCFFAFFFYVVTLCSFPFLFFFADGQNVRLTRNSTREERPAHWAGLYWHAKTRMWLTYAPSIALLERNLKNMFCPFRLSYAKRVHFPRVAFPNTAVFFSDMYVAHFPKSPLNYDVLALRWRIKKIRGNYFNILIIYKNTMTYRLNWGLNKAIMGPSTQQLFFSSFDVIATTCFDHTTIISNVLSQAVCLTAIAVSWISNQGLWLPW
jgi:hypothetical protein